MGLFCQSKAIVSKECTVIGVAAGLDGGAVCYTCLLIIGKRGKINPRSFLRRWHDPLQRSLYCRGRSMLTSTDIEDARNFSHNNEKKLKEMGKSYLLKLRLRHTMKHE